MQGKTVIVKDDFLEKRKYTFDMIKTTEMKIQDKTSNYYGMKTSFLLDQISFHKGLTKKVHSKRRAQDVRLKRFSNSEFFKKITEAFRAKNPTDAIVYLKSGHDWRFERLGDAPYFELEFPKEKASIKKLMFGWLKNNKDSKKAFHDDWINKISEERNVNVLILADDLFSTMNLTEVENILKKLNRRFLHSHLITEVAKINGIESNFKRRFPFFNSLSIQRFFRKFGPGYKLILQSKTETGRLLYAGINHYS